MLKSTRIGTGKGTPDISPTAFLVDKCNKIYLSGWGSNLGGPLSTLNLPVTDSAFQTITDGNDFYLAVYNEQIDSLEYATYFGGSQSTEHVDGEQVDLIKMELFISLFVQDVVVTTTSLFILILVRFRQLIIAQIVIMRSLSLILKDL